MTLNFFVFHHQPPTPMPTQNQSLFHYFISQPVPPTALHIHNQFFTANYPTPQLHLLIINIINRLQTTQPPVNAPPLLHELSENVAIIRNYCMLLHESYPARFADAISIQLENLDQLQKDSYKLQQRLTLYWEYSLSNRKHS